MHLRVTRFESKANILISLQYLSGQNIRLVPIMSSFKALEKYSKFGVQALIPLTGETMKKSAKRATQDKQTNLGILGELDKNLLSLDTEVYGSTNIAHTYALITVCNNLILFVATLSSYNIHKTYNEDNNNDSDVDDDEPPDNPG